MGNPVLPLPQITHVCNCGVDGKRSPSPASDNPCLQLWGIRGTQSFLCSRQPMFATVGWMGNPVLPLLQTTHFFSCGVDGKPSPSPALDNPCLQLWGIRKTQSFLCSRQPMFATVGWMGNPVLTLLQTTHVCNCGVDGEPSPSPDPDNPCLQLWADGETSRSPAQDNPCLRLWVDGEPSPSPASDNPCLQLWGRWET